MNVDPSNHWPGILGQGTPNYTDIWTVSRLHLTQPPLRYYVFVALGSIGSLKSAREEHQREDSIRRCGEQEYPNSFRMDHDVTLLHNSGRGATRESATVVVRSS